MRDYNIHEPLEVGRVRGDFDHTMYIKARDVSHIISQASSQLLYRDLSEHVRAEREDQLMYGYCEAVSAYCELIHDLNIQKPYLPKTTHRAMEVSVEKFKEHAELALDFIEIAQKKFGTQETWYPEYVKFGKWLIHGDNSVDPMQLAENAIKSANEAMETIRTLENSQRNGEEFDEVKFGEACQKLGEGKTMIESCLYPAMKMLGNEKAANILKVAKYGFIDDFIKTHNLESHLTPRGFMLSQTNKDKERKNYLPTYIKNLKVLSDITRGMKLVQKENQIGTQAQVKIPIKDKALTATVGYTGGISRQYDPNASEFKQKVQTMITAVNSALDLAGDAISAYKDPLKFIKKNASITIDPNNKIQGDEKKFNPHTIIDTMPDKPTMELNADGTENIEKYNQDLDKEHLDMVIELAKMALHSSDIEINDKELDEYTNKLNKLSTLVNTNELYKLDKLEIDNVLSAINACADLVYEYSDIDKLKKLDIEIGKLSSFARETIQKVRDTAEKCYWKELEEEKQWEAENPSYVRNRQIADEKLAAKGYVYDEKDKYVPVTHERDER